MSGDTKTKGLLERFKDGEKVICAEGYLFEFERRGYLKAGAFVPEVILEHPDLVEQLYEEFVHAGSDVVEAFTYYAHREKLKVVGREGDLEKINRKALQLARKVADRNGVLMAGNICNTTIYNPNQPETFEKVKAIFKEQIEWAAEEGADLVIAETIGDYGEMKIALDCIKEFGKGMPSVLTFAPTSSDETHDGMCLVEACRKLQVEHGADVVGLNCHRGPEMILPLIRKIREACPGPIACLPVPYRTHEKAKSFAALTDPITGESSFPADLECWLNTRTEIVKFTEELKNIGVEYMGLCCGNRAHYIRSMAETLGRSPPASKYTADMSQHYTRLKESNKDYSYAGGNFVNVQILNGEPGK